MWLLIYARLLCGAPLVAQKVKNSPAPWEMWSSLFVQRKPGTRRPLGVLASCLVLTPVLSVLSPNTCSSLCTAPSWFLLLGGLYIHFGGGRRNCPWVSQTKWQQIVCVLLSASSWVVLERLFLKENAVFIPSLPQTFPQIILTVTFFMLPPGNYVCIAMWRNVFCLNRKLYCLINLVSVCTTN